MGAAVAESEFAAGRFWNARACAFVRSKSLGLPSYSRV